jgi:deazaflavin-dependent oxidoreductase (nitroreductase family)
MTLKQWLYRGGRPNALARVLNRAWATVHALGIAPNYLVTLEVRGRRSGDAIRLPLVMAVVGGERYLVSMLGDDVDWVRNVRAAGGSAVLQHGRREPVLLEDVAVEERAPILQAYLRCAPGARGHLPIDQHAPLAEFRRIAPRFPVFRVLPAPGG